MCIDLDKERVWCIEVFFGESLLWSDCLGFDFVNRLFLWRRGFFLIVGFICMLMLG